MTRNDGGAHRAAILDSISEGGHFSVPEIAQAVSLAEDTVRSHLRTLRIHGLVTREKAHEATWGVRKDRYVWRYVYEITDAGRAALAAAEEAGT